MHHRIYDLDVLWAKHLEGSYIPRAVFAQNEVTGGDVWFLDNGSRDLERDCHCNDLVVRWYAINQPAYTLGSHTAQTMPT